MDSCNGEEAGDTEQIRPLYEEEGEFAHIKITVRKHDVNILRSYLGYFCHADDAVEFHKEHSEYKTVMFGIKRRRKNLMTFEESERRVIMDVLTTINKVEDTRHVDNDYKQMNRYRDKLRDKTGGADGA